jgi:hypothetical protein
VNDDLMARVREEARRITDAESSTDQAKDPLIFLGKRVVPVQGPYTGARPTIEKVDQLPLSQIVSSVYAMGANRDPQYDAVVDVLTTTPFLKRENAKYPAYVASALQLAAEVYVPYKNSGGDRPFWDWISWYASTSPPKEEDTAGRYRGPVATRTVAAESDVRATADAVSMEMLGRGITDQEFERILNRTRKAEIQQPQITRSGTGFSTTEQGLTAQGRQDIIENILAKKPEYQEFQKATTLMSWFDEALNRRMQENV